MRMVWAVALACAVAAGAWAQGLDKAAWRALDRAERYAPAARREVSAWLRAEATEADLAEVEAEADADLAASEDVRERGEIVRVKTAVLAVRGRTARDGAEAAALLDAMKAAADKPEYRAVLGPTFWATSARAFVYNMERRGLATQAMRDEMRTAILTMFRERPEAGPEYLAPGSSSYIGNLNQFYARGEVDEATYLQNLRTVGLATYAEGLARGEAGGAHREAGERILALYLVASQNLFVEPAAAPAEAKE